MQSAQQQLQHQHQHSLQHQLSVPPLHQIIGGAKNEKFSSAGGGGGQKPRRPRRAHGNHHHRKVRRIDQFKNMCKKITTFMFSRVGLCFVLVGYVIIGGFIFQSIEGAHEQHKVRNKTLISDLVQRDTRDLVNDIWVMTKYEKVFHKANYTSKLRNKLVVFQRNLTEAVKKGYKGLDRSKGSHTQWTFAGAIVYSVTIVTSIGYGHITCETDGGKIATIFYALFGIPMMFLCLANIGSSMANLFRFVYAKVCCGYCNFVKRRNIRKKREAFAMESQVRPTTPGTAAVLSAAAAAASIGTPPNPYHMSPPQPPLHTTTSHHSDMQHKLSMTATLNNEGVVGVGLGANGVKSELLSEYESTMSLTGDHLGDLDEDDESTKKITVPISVSLFILLSYIICGGFFFKTLEGWTLLDGVYFCFITLSMIGLGDKVPGNSINDNQAEYKLFGCSLYLLMGLSILSMCFSLMQEEVSAKSRKLAVRLGIIDDPNFW